MASKAPKLIKNKSYNFRVYNSKSQAIFKYYSDEGEFTFQEVIDKENPWTSHHISTLGARLTKITQYKHELYSPYQDEDDLVFSEEVYESLFCDLKHRSLAIASFTQCLHNLPTLKTIAIQISEKTLKQNLDLTQTPFINALFYREESEENSDLNFSLLIEILKKHRTQIKTLFLRSSQLSINDLSMLYSTGLRHINLCFYSLSASLATAIQHKKSQLEQTKLDHTWNLYQKWQQARQLKTTVDVQLQAFTDNLLHQLAMTLRSYESLNVSVSLHNSVIRIAAQAYPKNTRVNLGPFSKTWAGAAFTHLNLSSFGLEHADKKSILELLETLVLRTALRTLNLSHNQLSSILTVDDFRMLGQWLKASQVIKLTLLDAVHNHDFPKKLQALLEGLGDQHAVELDINGYYFAPVEARRNLTVHKLGSCNTQTCNHCNTLVSIIEPLEGVGVPKSIALLIGQYNNFIQKGRIERIDNQTENSGVFDLNLTGDLSESTSSLLPVVRQPMQIGFSRSHK